MNRSTADVSVKPGYKTTEFWLALVAQLIGVLGLLGIVDSDTASPAAEAAVTAAFGLIGGLSTLGYSISRGATKKGALNNVIPSGGEI